MVIISRIISRMKIKAATYFVGILFLMTATIDAFYSPLTPSRIEYTTLKHKYPSKIKPFDLILKSERICRWSSTVSDQQSISTTASAGVDPLNFTADERESVFSFERRLKDAGVKAANLEHALFMDEGDLFPSRGLRTTKDIKGGEVIIELPRNQAICLDEGERTPFPQWVPEKQWKKMPWYAQLGLKLVYERKISSSPLKSSYAQLLPPPNGFFTPYHWSEEDLNHLQRVYPSLASKVDRQKKAWAALYDTLGKTRAVREDMDEETFVWAMESVLSRAFKGSFGTGFRSILPSLVLMGIFAGIYYLDQESIQVVQYVLDEYPFSALLPASLTLLPLFLEFIRSKGTYVLAPMIDSLNHRSSVPTDLDYDSVGQRFRLSLGQAYRAGEQVFMSYGAKTNDDLLLHYGFLEKDNGADIFEFDDLLGWLSTRRADIVNDDRIQTLYSKGLQDVVQKCRLGRGGRILDSKCLEGLRVLLASDDELRAENAITESIIQTPMFLTLDEFEDSVFSKELKSPTEMAVYEALLDACLEQRQKLSLSAKEEEEYRQGSRRDQVDNNKSDMSRVPALLIFSFRKEKLCVLEESISRFARLTGRQIFT